MKYITLLRLALRSEKTCKICCKTYTHNKYKYCSEECAVEFLRRDQVFRSGGPILSWCQICGKMNPVSSAAKFCSVRCRSRFHQRKLSEKKKIDRVCPICAQPFRGTRKSEACSPPCAKRLNQQNASKKRKARLESDPVYAKRHKESRRKTAAARYRADPILRARIKAAVALRHKTNPVAKIRGHLRRRVRSMVKDRIVGKSALVGCDSAFLKQWLERQFTGKMDWTNYGKKWVVDHRIPLAAFDLNDPVQRKRACHYTNLQPLTFRMNASKSDSITDPQLGLI